MRVYMRARSALDAEPIEMARHDGELQRNDARCNGAQSLPVGGRVENVK